jgi:hypothetical protein
MFVVGVVVYCMIVALPTGLIKFLFNIKQIFRLLYFLKNKNYIKINII